MHSHVIILCPYFIVPPCIPTSSSHRESNPTENLIPPGTSHRTFHCIERTSSYHTWYLTGHFIPPSAPHCSHWASYPTGHLSRLVHLTLPGISFYRAHFIPPCMSFHRASYRAEHLIPPSAPHPTVNVIPPGISSFHSTERTSSYRACHPTVHVIPPGAYHFAESILTKRVTQLCMSLFTTVFLIPLYISPYCWY